MAVSLYRLAWLMCFGRALVLTHPDPDSQPNWFFSVNRALQGSAAPFPTHLDQRFLSRHAPTY